jgi:hypothetical protein
LKLICVPNAPVPYHTPVLNELVALGDRHVLHMARVLPETVGPPVSRSGRSQVCASRRLL